MSHSHSPHFESRRERRLRAHPQWDQVELRLRSGWTPRRVVAWCRERFPGDEPLSVPTLYRFLKGKDEAWFIPRLRWLELAEEPSPEVLALEQHAALIQVHSARCNESLKLERSLGRPLPEARHNLELLHRLLLAHQQLRGEAGLEVPIGSGMVPASADGDPRAQGIALVDIDCVLKDYVRLPPGLLPMPDGTLRTSLLQVLIKHDGEWRTVGYHNVDAKPLPAGART